MTAIAMKLNIISVKESMKSHTLKQKLITDYYKKNNVKNIYNIPGQYKITKYLTTIH
jgi:hypothetical protein